MEYKTTETGLINFKQDEPFSMTLSQEEQKYFVKQAKQYRELMMLYNSAIKEVKTKLEVLNDELSIKNERNPIESVSSRVKSMPSIVDKLYRKGKKVCVSEVYKSLDDVAGIRIVCSFVDDIYQIANMLIRQDDITLVEVKDYIENIGSVSDKVLAKLKLDTSLVNIKQPGAYQYTVTYNKRVYVGIVNIKEPDKSLASITLKNITLLINDPVPTDLNSYIKESIPDNAKDKIKLDISKVNNRSAGTYQYTIDYNGKLYTGTVTVYSPQQDSVSKPDKEEKDDSTEVEPVNNE